VRAIQISSAGGPDVLTPVELPDPQAGPGTLLVEVAAAGVNYIDTYQRAGIYPMTLPYVPGLEGAGRVRTVGDGVSGFAAGDRVAWSENLGSYAELVAVAAEKAVPVPDALSDEVAAAALLQGMTAHCLVTDCHPVQPGEDVLVHAAAGGVGLLLTQLASRLGARVIATVSTAEKEQLARGAGAADVIRYTEVDDLAAEVRALTGGAGVAAVYDGVGRTTFDASLASLRRRGILVLFGAASGPVPPVDPQRLNAAGSLFLTRPMLAHYTRTPDEFAWRAGELLNAIAAGTINVTVSERYRLEDAETAHRDLQGRKTVGSVVLVP